MTILDHIRALMRTIDIPPPRELRCGRAAWDVLRNVSDKTTDVLGIRREPLGTLGIYGTPVHIDDTMPDAAWKILEGDRVVSEGNFAPGHRRAAFVPGVGLIAFSDDWEAIEP